MIRYDVHITGHCFFFVRHIVISVLIINQCEVFHWHFFLHLVVPRLCVRGIFTIRLYCLCIFYFIFVMAFLYPLITTVKCIIGRYFPWPRCFFRWSQVVPRLFVWGMQLCCLFIIAFCFCCWHSPSVLSSVSLFCVERLQPLTLRIIDYDPMHASGQWHIEYVQLNFNKTRPEPRKANFITCKTRR